MHVVSNEDYTEAMKVLGGLVFAVVLFSETESPSLELLTLLPQPLFWGHM